MLRLLTKTLVIVLLLLVAAIGLFLTSLAWNASRGDPHAQGQLADASRPVAATSHGPQILFGDLHVHTSYSADAHIQSLVLLDREGRRSPRDACDFARFCSQVDFWSMNDHAESLTPELWSETVDAVRECNASAGDPENPDMVSFLGWEWSHRSMNSETHYGHKNVVLRDLDENRIPARPIASAPGTPFFVAFGVIGQFTDGPSFADWSSFHRWSLDAMNLEDCPEDVPVRQLPNNCRESATTPRALFDKLSEWGHAAVVIPHGLAWGVTNPLGADLANQLGQHDPRWQPLLELYSGHGNSEVYRDFQTPAPSAEGEFVCPEEVGAIELCCQRARRMVRERCGDPTSSDCDAEVEAAASRAATPFFGQMALLEGIVPDVGIEEWGDCDQAIDSFLPAYDYRPKQSAQYALAVANDRGRETDKRFRWGFIGSSDNHRSRPGTGYKEFGRLIMTDGVAYPGIESGWDDRRSAMYFTGGLAAVHSNARDRESIFEALQNKHVYATSGDRIQLWFDLVQQDGTRLPMGSEVESASPPRFSVRAIGAFEQKPGCPEFVHDALSPERIASLCLGECFHPSDVRKPITRIEIVRVRPQARPDEPIAKLIEDPWQVHVCPADGLGCEIEFSDPDAPDDAAYYVRAIQTPSPALNGDPLRCERDASGQCVRSKPCRTRLDGTPENCLSLTEERAWSSPIFVSRKGL
ncbi:DUF3604 domain-containing protein [Myxococcota bacterium]|nr:DUF3604 domain-containing protein [Myxococcota bacterium]